MSIPSVSGIVWPHVSYFSTLRSGGFSVEPWASFNLGLNTQDDTHTVMRNRALLTESLPDEPRWLTQVHGTKVIDFDEPQHPSPEGDAAVTTTVNTVLSVLTADCLPVIISDYKATVLGIAHAGWRGLAAGVLEATLQAMQDKQPEHQRLRAWVGPAISQRHFEVGAEVREAFLGKHPNAAHYFVPSVTVGKYHADLAGLARLILINACPQGIDVMLSNECTHERDDRYFSYRRHSTTGRIASLAWLKPKV